MWTALISLIGGLGSDFLKNKQRKEELKDAKHQRELQRVINNEVAAGDADIESIKSRTWTDEYLVIISTAPLVILFFEPVFNAVFGATPYQSGDLQVGVMAGFEALKLMPEYVWWGIGMIYIDVLGFRRLFRMAIENVINKKLGIK